MDRPLHPDDLVAKKTNGALLAVVERTHADVDTHEARPGRTEPEPITHDKDVKKSAFTQFMRDGVPPKGTVLVRWQRKASAQLVSVSKLKLLDRSLLIGDVVKRNIQESASGIVLNTFTVCTLQPICDVTLNNGSIRLKGLLPATGPALDIRQRASGKPAPLVDVPASELQEVESPGEDDLVIYKDWIGRVDVATSRIVIRLSDNSVVEIDDELAEHSDGAIDNFVVGDIASTKKGHLRNGRWIYGQYNANTLAIGTIVDTRTASVEVRWLQRRIGSNESENEPPSLLERDELESSDFHIYDRTRRPRSGVTTETISNSHIDTRLNLRVRFKDLSGACVKYDGSTEHGRIQRIHRGDTLGYDLNVFDIVSFHTDVVVQWQDLSVTRSPSIDLVPDASIDDEHAAWPGEIAHTLDYMPVNGMLRVTQPSKTGVVQSVNASERMAIIRWCQDACVQYLQDEDDPGLKSLLTGAVGCAGGEQEEVSLYDVEAPGAMNVRRGDIVLIVNPRWKNAGLTGQAEKFDWLGEIVDTRLDATLTVRLGAAQEVTDVNLRHEDVRVAVRSDGTEDVDDEWDDGEFPTMGLDSDGEEMVLAGQSSVESSMMGDSEREGWSSEDEGMDILEATYEDENGEPLEEEDVEGGDWESDLDEAMDIEMPDAPQETPPTSHSATPEGGKRKDDVIDTESQVHQQYVILESAVPASHHFSSELPTEAAVHIKRTSREHKILGSANALPSGVYVRTWESRLDLIRVLFIGPADTPYADAPFVFDFYLSSSFPLEPPQAYFHSWPAESGLGGVGKVNPNLYEDGKICLSLLGTWAGSQGESWSAGRSTLLQCFVSLLGLVLVREPYFNEAGYEPLAGLESSKRPSALYSERTYLRSRAFIISALMKITASPGSLDTGLEGLEDVLTWLYKDPSGPKLLDKVMADADAVLQRSEHGADEPNGLDLMSKGACIPLRRVSSRLRQLLP